MRGVLTLVTAASLLALIHACSLDNNILKPKCRIFEIDLVERWWYPKDSQQSKLYFKSNGEILMPASNGSWTFSLENCNKIQATDDINSVSEQWVIKALTDKDLQIAFDNNTTVSYTRNH